MFYVNARAIIEREQSDGTQIVIQTRNKPNEPQRLELPGGRIEPFESLTQALRREVMEETGLDIVKIEGEETRVDTSSIDSNFIVECIRPFAAYQTTCGPVDSVGYYFRCQAEGELWSSGDETRDIQWMDVERLSAMMQNDPLQFADVDRAGILFYIRQLNQSNGNEDKIDKR